MEYLGQLTELSADNIVKQVTDLKKNIVLFNPIRSEGQTLIGLTHVYREYTYKR